MTFSRELRRLWEAAGDPTLKDVSGAVAERGRPAGIRVPGNFLARLSDWRSGRHLPREFEGLLLMTIAELLDRARARDAVAGVPDRVEAWEEVWRQARLAELTREVTCPYPGLAAYGPEATSRFFGRDRQIAAITALVDDALADGGGVVALVGVSGSGKSSLLAAGVRPALLGRGVRVVAMTPGDDPQHELARVLAETDAESGPLVVVIDQAEELFTAAPRAGTTAFLETLTSLTTARRAYPIAVVIGLRADFVGEWLSYPQLLDALNKRTHLLGAMSRADLREVITAPAAAVGVKVEPGLAERILAEFCGSSLDDYDAGALPLLNHALATLWVHRSGNRLTLKAFEKSGGVFGMLDDAAEQLWGSLEPDVQVEVRRLLPRLVHLDESGRSTRLFRPRAELLAGAGDRLPQRTGALDALLQSRLLTVDADDRVSFTHEIVMRVWTRLRGWIDDNRADLLGRQQLEAAAAEWDRAERDRSLLLRGPSLARAHQSCHTGDVSPAVTVYVERSDQSELRGTRRRRMAVVAISVAAVLGLLLSVFAIQLRGQAINERTAAEYARLTAEADRLRSSDPTTSARLTQLALQLDPSDVNRSRLVATANLPLAIPLQAQGGAVYSVAISPDGRQVAGTGSDGAARIWPIDQPESDPLQLRGHSAFLTSVAWSPDGKRLATTSDDGTARIWTDPGSAEAPIVLMGHDGRVVYAAWSPDGGRLVTAGMDSTVRVWDTHNGAQLAELDGHTADVRAVAWSPDGSTIASGSTDRTARLWDGESYAARGVLTGYRDTVHALDFRADSTVLATGSDDATVVLYDVAHPDSPRQLGAPITAHTAPVWSVAFAPDGSRLVSASLDGTARVWSVADPAVPVQVGATLAGAANSLFSTDFSPDGRRVVTSGADGRILIWTLPGTDLAGHTGRVIAPAIVGDRMVTGGSGGMLRVWDLTDRIRPRGVGAGETTGGARIDQVSLSANGRLAAAATGTSEVQIFPLAADGAVGRGVVLGVQTQDQQHALFAPSGSLLVTGARDDSFQFWRVAPDGAATRVGEPLVHDDGGTWATAAAWSPDGTRLVTAGSSGTLNVWNVADPAHPSRIATASGEPGGGVDAVAWSSDGVIAAGGDGGVIQLWRVGDGVLEQVATARQERGGTVRSLAFSADGARLVSAGDGQTLMVWSVEPNALLPWGEPIGPAGAGRWYAAVTGDGAAVAVGGDHGALTVVLLDAAHADQRINAASLPLTAEERARFGIR
ncbi:MAG: AAA family ATPase [Gordonia sp. (in: high G+C Gram-positive bacteria)]|uniref:nSTAND1 domain-containing NTPase n=1 Tax=Gordonia sp. (in: high G+C Gram-positive bacteria) TaxID=84139 RepID=UPI003BB5687B